LTPAELDNLVAQIGEEILARLGRAGLPAAPKKGEGRTFRTKSAGLRAAMRPDVRAQHQADSGRRGGPRFR